MRKTIGTALVAGGALFAAGCGASPEILEGRPAEVLNHRFDDRDEWLQPICGKTCVLIPQSDPAHYYLELEQCDRTGDEFADERGCVQDTVEVEEETYYEFQDGDQITLRGDG